MDPARGRRWVGREAFLRDVYLHRMSVPADAFREFAASDGFTRPLAHRLHALGAPDGEALIARALEDPGWSAVAALDGAARTVAALVASGAIARGAEAGRLVASLASGPAVPLIYSTAAAAPAAEDGTAQVAIRGAVLLRASAAGSLDAAQKAALPVELRAAVEEPRPRAAAELWRLLARDGRGRWAALAVGVVLAALGSVAEALLFRALIDLAVGRGGGSGSVGFLTRFAGHALGGAPLGSGALAGAILVLLVALLALELPLAGSLRRAGARLEEQLRALYLRKIPRLPDRYFQSRPVSDMAERAHLLHRLRTLPTLGGEIARTALEIVVITGGLAWLAPRGAGLAIALGLVALLVPFVAEPAVAERDLRMRNHAGALGRFYLDGLLGLVAVRTHGAEPALAREHRDRLREWVAAARRALGAALAAEAVQTLLGLALAVRLLVGFFARGATTAGAASATTDPGTALLLVYWALSLPALGQELTALVQQIPAQRNLTLRLLEPLGAPEDDAAGAARAAQATQPARAAQATQPARAAQATDTGAAADDTAPGVRVQLDDVRVVAGGHQILEIGALAIAPGEAVAIVGASGAGKSSLVGLLLGWHRPATGTVRIDGAPLDGAGIEALRRRTVWIDPAVYLWNRSLADNLAFGLAATPEAFGAVLDEAELGEVVRRLPEGLKTPLGEAGGLVSGGEGQRVRFGRGLLRARPRLVILDEPFRGLSRDQRQALLARARRRWSSATLFCVTHDIAETAAFPRVLVIADGRVAEDGAPAALLVQPGSRYAALA
jgi:ATP-binding cassette subfamily B protein